MAADPYTLEQAEEDISTLNGQVSLLEEQHTVTDGGVVPNTPAAGAFALYSSGGQPNWVDPAGQLFGVPGAQNAFYPGHTVTAASLNNLAAYTIPAGAATANAVYEVEVWGNGTWGSTGQTLQLAVLLGGNTMSSVTLGTQFMATSAAFRFRVAVRAVCQTTGAGGTWSSMISGEVSVFGANLLAAGGASANASNGFCSCESTGTTTVDTTVNEDLGLSAAWGSTTGSPTLTSRVAIAKRIC